MRRRLAEERVRAELVKAQPTLGREQSQVRDKGRWLFLDLTFVDCPLFQYVLNRWFLDVKGPSMAHEWEDDETVATWFASNCQPNGELREDSQIAYVGEERVGENFNCADDELPLPDSRNLKNVAATAALDSLKQLADVGLGVDVADMKQRLNMTPSL